ncbi:MAG: phage virion morphogenesis protein [Pseudomonadota bacterium]
MITVEITDQETRKAFANLIASAENPKQLMAQIGELLVDSTKQRFATSTAPDGSRWAENSDITLLGYLDKYKGSYRKKDGGLTQKGAKRLGGKKPLIGESGALSTTIAYKIEGVGTLIIGSPMEYAGAHQFGMEKGYAGSTKGGAPIPWGDIPAREFLGLSDQDQVMILELNSDFLSQSFRP